MKGPNTGVNRVKLLLGHPSPSHRPDHPALKHDLVEMRIVRDISVKVGEIG